MTLTQTHHPHTDHPQGTFNGSRNLKLFYQSWYPSVCNQTVCAQDQAPTCCEQSSHSTASSETASSETASSETAPSKEASVKNAVKGVLAIVHGIGEHSGRYCAIVEGLTAAGYAVFGFDNQGHGKSEGQRGHIESWSDYRTNTQSFLELVRQKEPTAPLFLMGHSLGGLIVLDYVLRNAHKPEFKALNVEGLVVSAPPIQPMGGTTSTIRIILARLLSGVLPRLRMKMGLSQNALSRDQDVMEQIEHDPLTHCYVTLRWGSETLSTIDWVKKHIQQLRLPILLTHGEADRIVAPDGTRSIYQQIESPNKALNIYPGSYHEPHNDLDAKSVVADLLRWMEKGCLAT